MKVILSGNEAIARGAYEAGVKVATAYPGTPSTEILEEISKYDEIYSEWSTNEKVAFEVALGAAYGGVRAITCMKHVGLNVAADPFMSSAYTGVLGGFVIVSADDPGLHSSQNEQDNRIFAKFAKVPLIEPSDSQEAKDFILLAFEISEQFKTPVLFRSTTRISHSKSVVELGERKEVPAKQYIKDVPHRVVIPSNARILHLELEKKLEALKEYSENSPLNRLEMGDTSIGIITSGISYQYAREVFPSASFLKLGMSFPFPENLVKKFAALVKEIIVIEENEPFIEDECRKLGLKVTGKDKIPICWELNQQVISEALTGKKSDPIFDTSQLPTRPPVLCPGCPHRGFFYISNRLKLTATGDIGCYTLGVIPPLSALDTCVCMGASVGNAYGMELAMKEYNPQKRVIAVIGDSTFIHGGITGLIDIAYNKGKTVVVILDNETTAMTGHQPHPGTGKTIKGEDTVRVNYAKLAEAVGIKNYFETQAFDLENIRSTMKQALALNEPALVVNKGACVLQVRGVRIEPYFVDAEKCTSCGLCLQLGCPAISRSDDGKAKIDPILCVGDLCGLCMKVCKFEAIKPREAK